MKWNKLAALCAAVWLSACATEWQKQHAEDGRDVMRLHTVRNSTLPESGMIKIGEQDLQAGDILFSSEASVQSLGIRLFSNAAVSHVFLYLGDGEIAEAVGAGVRIRRLGEALKESNLTAAFRRPRFDRGKHRRLARFRPAAKRQALQFSRHCEAGAVFPGAQCVRTARDSAPNPPFLPEYHGCCDDSVVRQPAVFLFAVCD